MSEQPLLSQYPRTTIDNVIGIFTEEFPAGYGKVKKEVNNSLVREETNPGHMNIENIFDIDLEGRTLGDLNPDVPPELADISARKVFHEFRARIYSPSQSPTIEAIARSMEDPALRSYTLILIANSLEPALVLAPNFKVYATTPFFKRIANSDRTTARMLDELAEPQSRSKHKQIMLKYKAGTDDLVVPGKAIYVTSNNAKPFMTKFREEVKGLNTPSERSGEQYMIVLDYYETWIKELIANINKLGVIENDPLFQEYRDKEMTSVKHHIDGENRPKVEKFYADKMKQLRKKHGESIWVR